MDIYKTDEKLVRKIERIKNSTQISERNKDDILGFERYCRTIERLSFSRVLNYMVQLEKMGKITKKDFVDFNEDDVLSLVETIETNGYVDKHGERKEYEAKSVTMLRCCLKKFFRWLRHMEKPDYPPEVKHLRTSIKRCEEKIPDILLSQEMNKIIQVAQNPRDRAFAAVICEAGVRPAEIILMKIKDCVFDQYGVAIKVDGKTGERRIRLVTSAVYLSIWLDNHPHKDDIESFVWVGQNSTNKGNLLSYRAASNIVKGLAEKAGVKKRIYPYLFRHSRLTQLAKDGFQNEELKIYSGWVTGEPARFYIHLSGGDIENKILKINGIKKDEETKTPKTVECPRCHMKANLPNQKFCFTCGFALYQKDLVEMEERKVRMNTKMDKLMQDEEVQEFLKKKIVELKLDS